MTKRIRRTPQQWQQIIDQQSRSGQAARQFCADNDLNYSVFCKWRRKLAPSQPGAAFLDVSSLVVPEPTPTWEVELDLGGGMALRLRRG